MFVTMKEKKLSENIFCDLTCVMFFFAKIKKIFCEIRWLSSRQLHQGGDRGEFALKNRNKGENFKTKNEY